MRNSQFRDVAEQLLDAGVSPRRVRRMMSELADHYDDLREELRARGLSSEEVDAEAFARLGTRALVEGVLARPELRSWARRWPWLAFTVVPLGMYAALSVATILIAIFSIDIAKSAMGVEFASSSGLQVLARALLGSVVWVAPIVAAAACCAVALSRRVAAIWAVVGVVLISCVGALINAQLELPPVVTRPAIGAGIGFSTDSLLPPISRAALTLTIVLSGYFWIRRARSRATSSQAE
jgi:hypothetical protein